MTEKQIQAIARQSDCHEVTVEAWARGAPIKPWARDAIERACETLRISERPDRSQTPARGRGGRAVVRAFKGSY